EYALRAWRSKTYLLPHPVSETILIQYNRSTCRHRRTSITKRDSMQIADVIAEVDAECRRWEVKMLGPQKAVRLAYFVHQVKPGLVVEVGTAIGYSGLWIVDGLRGLGHGRLITFELDPDRAAQAGQNFKRAGLDHLITQYVGDAREKIKGVVGLVDLLF